MKQALSKMLDMPMGDICNVSMIKHYVNKAIHQQSRALYNPVEIQFYL